jgi:nicotinamide mononucleotide transporter
MNIIEIIAVIFSLTSVILTVKNNILCWPVGIIGIIFYLLLFQENHIWGNMVLQVLFIVQSIFGWINWNKPSKYPISWIYPHNRGTVFISMLLLSFIMVIFLRENGGKMPYFDGITTSLSIVAMVLLSYRKIDNWIYWIIADMIFIFFFYINSLYLSAGIYLVFLLLAISGLTQWKKSIKVVS